MRESLKVPARVWRATFAAFFDDECTAELGTIRAPTELVGGTRDAFVCRADQDALLRAIPGSRLRASEGAGHALHWEEPARFASDSTRFVERLSLC